MNYLTIVINYEKVNDLKHFLYMDEVPLKYGNENLTFKKSQIFIAIKPSPSTDKQLLSVLAPQINNPNIVQSNLGGFQIVNVIKNSKKNAIKEPLEKTLDKLRDSPAITSGTHVFYTSDDEVPFIPTGQLYIKFDDNANQQQCIDLIDQHHLQILESRGQHELIVQITPESENPLKTAYSLQASPLVKVAEPDLATPGKLHGFIVPTDPRIVDQWHLRNLGRHRGTDLGFLKGADARVINAWETAQSIGSPNVIVAVIDDGFDLSHPDLNGDWKIIAPKDFLRNSNNPIPDFSSQDWHGTACAGVAIGNADGTGISGAAPRSRFMPIRWSGGLGDQDIENWFAYAREQGAWVVSCSWAAQANKYPLSFRKSEAIKRCAQEGRSGLGTVICFAAGNENRDINKPEVNSINGFAIHPDVIAVSASNSRDQRSNYSNFGKDIWVCAPSSGAGGWGITTSDVMGQFSKGTQTFEAGYAPGAYTDDFSGTSSSCPLVAGVCALLLSIKPTLTAKQVKELLKKTARRIGDLSKYNEDGHSVEFGYGCIDAESAILTILNEMNSQ